jgi:hypothetical protein
MNLPRRFFANHNFIPRGRGEDLCLGKIWTLEGGHPLLKEATYIYKKG